MLGEIVVESSAYALGEIATGVAESSSESIGEIVAVAAESSGELLEVAGEAEATGGMIEAIVTLLAESIASIIAALFGE